MKIVVVSTSLEAGGAERVASIVANRLSIDNEVSLVTVQGDKRNYELYDSVDYRPIIVTINGRIKRKLSRLCKVRKELFSIKPDVVVSFETENNIYSILCSFFGKHKVVISERNDPNRDPASKFTRYLRKVLYPLADGYVFQTKDARDYFDKKIQVKSIVIPNPITIKKENETNVVRQKEIVTACRLYPQKNLKLFIDIIVDIHRLHKDYIGVIYGDGPERDILMSYCKGKNASNYIEFRGFSKNVHDKMKGAYAYICSSDYEGISNSMIEAMALGLPTIATDCPIGGSAMAIKDGINGFLFPVGDKTIAVDKINRLINDSKLYETISKNASKISDEWSVDKIVESWQKYIDMVVKDENH